MLQIALGVFVNVAPLVGRHWYTEAFGIFLAVTGACALTAHMTVALMRMRP